VDSRQQGVSRWGQLVAASRHCGAALRGIRDRGKHRRKIAEKGADPWRDLLAAGNCPGLVFDFVAEIVYAIGMSLCAELGAQTVRTLRFGLLAESPGWFLASPAALSMALPACPRRKCCTGCSVAPSVPGLRNRIQSHRDIDTWRRGKPGSGDSVCWDLRPALRWGLVESALKDRWLYVTAGPLAGKQFILYKPRTIVGSDQKCDIYLFKDSNIAKEHAIIDWRGRVLCCARLARLT